MPFTKTITSRNDRVYDYIPDAVNFLDINENAAGNEWTYTSQQITGIDKQIEIRVGYNDDVQLWYQSGPLLVVPDNNTPPDIYGFNMVNSADGWYVNNLDFVIFGVTSKGIAIDNTIQVTRFDPHSKEYLEIDTFVASKL